MLKGILSFVVEPGDESGEDVFIRARLESDAKPGAALTEEDFAALKEQLRAAYRNEHMCLSWWTEDGPDGIAVEHFAEEEVWIGDMGGVEKVRTAASGDYELEVEELAETLFADLKRLYEKGNWKRNRRSKVWWVEKELYRHGTAE